MARKNNKNVSVIGIGRVGLPLSLVIAEAGYTVYGIDISRSYINYLKTGSMPFMEEGAKRLLKKHVNKRFFPTTSRRFLTASQVIFLTLGTPIDENMNPVLDQLDKALQESFPFLKKGQLIILRSTVSPRTTKYVKEKLEMNTKLKVGRDIFLAYCPERIAEGRAIKEIREIPQIIGGIDEISSQKAKEFFEGIGIACLVSTALSAELAKLFTNMYRYISFAIANEFMVIAESFDRNIHEIVDLVNTGYKRGGLALPGLTGGPCLFKDGFFLVNENPFLDLITASWKINETMPLFLVRKLQRKTKLKNRKVVILGLGFKPEIDDIRESLSFKIRKALLREHAKVVLHDPYVSDYPRQEVIQDLDKAIKDVKIVIVAMRHKFYEKKKSRILKLIGKGAVVCDIWNLFGKNQLVFKT